MAAPPLPPRQPIKSTELDRHAMESASGGGRPSKSENSRIRNEVVGMYKSFVSEVDPKDVLDLLIQRRVISIERKEELMSKVTKQDRCRALLDQLFSCSNDAAFLVLRQALYEHYHWIAERIDESKYANNEVISSGNLELSKSNEVKLTPQLDETSRKITELEEEVTKYRNRNLVLESELSLLQGSYDEALKRELTLKEQLASLKDWTIPTESEDEDADALNPAVKMKTQSGEGPAKRLTPPPPLPKRPTDQVELDKNSMETDELQTTCFRLKDYEIICSDLNLESLVESFRRTEIWKGKLKKSTDVSVKKCIDSELSAAEFFIEAQLLHRLKHPSIVELIGVSSLTQPLLIVTEYLSYGNLRDHLRNDQGNTVDLPLILDFAGQIADGMFFVATQGIVHQHLYTGNLLLASPKLVKISNFEFALDLQDPTKDHIIEGYKSILLTRWSAPESICNERLTPASNVWSFGILLYEMFTFGEIPYKDLNSTEVVQVIQTDYRLPRPENKNKLFCPETVYQTMVRCWDKDPDARPSFDMLQCYFLEEFSQVSKADVVLNTILSQPQLVTIIKGRTAVRGLALLDGWLYVARLGSSQVEVYDARDDFKRSKKNIAIASPGQREKVGILNRLKPRPKKEHVSSGIQDIVSCNRHKRLYLSDWQNMCVHCVDPVGKEVIRSWGVESGEPWGISVTSEGYVVISCGDSGLLCEFSGEGLLMRKIRLEVTDDEPLYGFQLFDDDSWVICYGSIYRNVVDGHVSIVKLEGNCVISHEEIQLKGPSHLAVLSSHHVLVAESTRNRIILLHPSLRGPVREILNADHGIMNPVRIHLCESSGRLVVGLVDGTVLVYQIMKVADEPSTTLSN